VPALLVAVTVATVAGAADPWIITDQVVISEPTRVGDVIVLGHGSLTVRGVPEPGLEVAGNLWALGSSTILLSDSVIRVESVYNGQYALVGADDARLEVTGCDYRVPSGVQHALLVAGDAELVVADTDFGDVQLITANSSRLEATRLNGHFEVIVQDAAAANLTDIPRDPDQGNLWVWVEFGSGSRAEYSPPLPGFVDHWSFPPEGAAGIPQSVEMSRCEVLLWPLLVRPDSDLTLRDIDADNWVVVGLHLPADAAIADLVNGTSYVDHELGLADRRLLLADAAVDTWNLYPEDGARVEVRDSVLGEILSMGSSEVRVDRTTVDGTGGFLGARDRSRITAAASHITCTVEATQDAAIELHHSVVEPYATDPEARFTRFGAYDRGRLLADHTSVATIPVLDGKGVIAVAYIADPPPVPPGAGAPVELDGWAAVMSLDEDLARSGWRLDAVPRLGGVPVPIATGDGNVEGGALGAWGGADPAVDHLLQLTLWDGWGRLFVGGRWVSGTGPHLRSGNGRRP